MNSLAARVVSIVGAAVVVAFVAGVVLGYVLGMQVEPAQVNDSCYWYLVNERGQELRDWCGYP